MALTRDFKATVQARVQADPAFREALLREGIETMLRGEVDTGKAILRDYIKATVGFEKSRRRYRLIRKEPHPHVWPNRQSTSAQSFRGAATVAEACRVDAACDRAGALMINEPGPLLIPPLAAKLMGSAFRDTPPVGAGKFILCGYDLVVVKTLLHRASNNRGSQGTRGEKWKKRNSLQSHSRAYCLKPTMHSNYHKFLMSMDGTAFNGE